MTEKTNVPPSLNFGMPSNPFNVTSTIIINDGPNGLIRDTDSIFYSDSPGLKFPNLYSGPGGDYVTKRYDFLKTCAKRTSDDLLKYKEREADPGVQHNSESERAIYNRDRIETLARAYDADFYTFMVDLK